MFGVPKHIAHKRVIKSNYFLQKTFINFYKPQFQTGSTKNSENEKTRKKMQHFGLKN